MTVKNKEPTKINGSLSFDLVGPEAGPVESKTSPDQVRQLPEWIPIFLAPSQEEQKDKPDIQLQRQLDISLSWSPSLQVTEVLSPLWLQLWQ